MTHPPAEATRGSLLMIGSTICFAVMVIGVRLASAELHAFEIVFFRNFFGLVFALPLLLRRGLGGLRTRRVGVYAVRCLVGLGAMLCGFWALVHLPLTLAVALSYTAPLFITVLAALVLDEEVRLRRWTAVLAGFLGVLVILRPGYVPISLAALAALASAGLAAVAGITIKLLSRTEPSEAIVIYMVLIMTPLSLLTALPVWAWPSPTVWLWLALTGLMGTTAHVMLTNAYKLHDASALTPLSFVQLPVVALLAWLLFDETVDGWTIAGAAVILLSTGYIARREALVARRQITDPAVAEQSKL